MPDLAHTLQGRDLGFLKIVSELWGVSLALVDSHSALSALVPLILDPGLVHETVSALDSNAQAALSFLLHSEGKAAWSIFSRRFGTIREMGPGQRDRKKPYENPVSPTEILWYRALIGRAFLDADSGPQEFAYIPDDLIPLLPSLEAEAAPPPGRLASPAERGVILPASDHILDAACTLLAGLRMGWALAEIPWNDPSYPKEIVFHLLDTAGLLDAAQIPLPDPTRAFLESPRPEALHGLVKAWLSSTRFNELRLVPELHCEGEWSNDPLAARKTILDLLRQVPQSGWWSLAGFVAALHERTPDFQRPAGDYDSWFIQDKNTGEYIRGSANWDRVEGALVRFIIRGPLYWLGFVDLAAPDPASPPTAFRITPWAGPLLAGELPGGLPGEEEPVFARSDGLIRLPAHAPRAARYQIARYGEWLDDAPSGEYRYRVTPASLDRARKQGLRPSGLVSLLRRHAAGPVPPTLVQAIEHWEQNGIQARLESVVLLRVGSPEIMAALKRSKAARFLGPPLNPTTVVVQSGVQAKVMAVLAELGYLAEGEWEQPAEEITRKDGE